MLAAFPYALTFKVSLKFLCFICVEKLISSKFGITYHLKNFSKKEHFLFKSLFLSILKYLCNCFPENAFQVQLN